MIGTQTKFGRRSALAGALAAAAVCGLAAQAIAAGSGGLSSDGSAGGGSEASEDGVFPVRAKHEYGDGIGAGRGHQGQDLLAKCGKKVVAAQAGRIELVDYHSAAGNYVVVHGKRKAPDTVYMHLLRRASVKEGQVVAAGQKLGRVGSTGRSSACHLHFEMWSPPGYYKGGSVIDPTPYLHRWDKSG